eukprot:TRINITY_DN10702_c0_g1_i1.p1 TRINITY_DN10702_c0_g1~~TRINITY_DN10702_c0_g1_i1.p1  ORF type:complete len:733 (+),score=133.86 TRINITY_DN10702_c0_g1_i1:384-2582(+)
MTPPLVVSMLNASKIPYYVDPSEWYMYVVDPPAKGSYAAVIQGTPVSSVETQLQWTYVSGIGGSSRIGVIHLNACIPASFPFSVQDPSDHIFITLSISALWFAIGIVLHFVNPRIWRCRGVGGRVPELPSWEDVRAVFSFNTDVVRARAGPGAAIYLNYVRSIMGIGIVFSVYWVLAALNYTYGQERYQSGVGLLMPDNVKDSQTWLTYLNDVLGNLGIITLWVSGAIMTVQQKRLLFDKKPPSSVTDITLHFQRLPKTITGAELHQRLAQAIGSARAILAVHLIRHPTTKQSTGHAFVTFDRVIGVNKLRKAMRADSTHRYSTTPMHDSYTLIAEYMHNWQQFAPLPKNVEIAHGANPENIVWPNFLLPPAERPLYRFTAFSFNLGVHILGTAVSIGALVAQNLLATPKLILMLDQDVSTLSAALGVGVTLLLSLFRIGIAQLAWRVCLLAHDVNRVNTEQRYMTMERNIQFGSIVTGTTLWTTIGTALLTVFAGFDDSSKFTLEFIMSIMIQMMLFEPGVRLIDVKHTLLVLKSLVTCSKMPERKDPIESEFPFANRYALIVNLPLVSVTGGPVAGMLLLPVLLGVYFFDRYQLLYVHRRRTNIELHRDMAFFGGKAQMVFSVFIAGLAFIGVVITHFVNQVKIPAVNFAVCCLILAATIVFVPLYRWDKRRRHARIKASDLHLRLLDWAEMEQQSLRTAFAPPSWFLKAEDIHEHEQQDRGLFEGPDFM